MKKLFVLMSIGMIVFLSFLVPSCRQSDSLNDIPNAEADRFVASAECQKVLNESYSFAQKIYQSISVLSAEEREKVSKLCTEIQNAQIYATVEDLLQELQMLMGIDYLGHAYKMKDLSSGIFVNQNFTSEQYAMAIRKYQYLRLSKTQNRVNTKSTDIPTTSDTPLEACIQGCYFAYNRDLRDCENGGFGHEHERAEDLILCQMILQSKLTECIKRCQEMYTPSIPDSTTTTRPVTPDSTTTRPVEPGTTDPTKPDPTKPTGNN